MFIEKPGTKGNKGSDDLWERSHPVKLLTYEKELKKSLNSEGNYQKQKAETKFQPQEAELGSFGHVVLTLAARIQEKRYGFSLCG